MARVAKRSDLAESPVLFGEVLFDRFPDGSEVLGGAPFNVAWHLQGLGASPLLLSRVGEDELGDRVHRSMTEWGLDTSALQRDAELPTGTVEVRLQGGEPAFEIVPQQAYDRIELDDAVSGSNLGWLYLGSLALRQRTSRRTARSLLQRKVTPVFLDVNLRPPWWQIDLVLELLDRAQEIKLNDTELAELMPGDEGLDEKARKLMSRFGADRLYVTRGARGAVAFTVDGRREIVRPTGAVRVVDTVGAGDAFAAVLLLARLKNWSLALALERAQAFAAAIVGVRGATVLDRLFYQQFRSAWRLE